MCVWCLCDNPKPQVWVLGIELETSRSGRARSQTLLNSIVIGGGLCACGVCETPQNLGSWCWGSS